MDMCLFHSHCSDPLHFVASVALFFGAFLVIGVLIFLAFAIKEFVQTTNACNDLSGENYRHILAIKDHIRHLEERLPKGDS